MNEALFQPQCQCSLSPTGLLIFIIEAQRGFGRPVLVALVLFFIISILVFPSGFSENEPADDSRAKVPVSRLSKLKYGILLCFVVLVLPFLVFQTAKTSIVLATGKSSTGNLLDYLSAADVNGASRSYEMRPWRRVYVQKIPAEIKSTFAVRKWIHELFSEPTETIRHFFRKNATLANPSGTLLFSSKSATDPGVGRTNTTAVRTQISLHRMLASVLYFLLFLRLALFPVLPVNRGAFFLLLFTGFFYLFILLFTESQPRYSLFSSFLISLLVSQLVFDLRDSLGDINSIMAGLDRLKPVLSVFLTGFSGAAILLVLFFLLSGSLSLSQWTLTDMRGFKTITGGKIFSNEVMEQGSGGEQPEGFGSEEGRDRTVIPGLSEDTIPIAQSGLMNPLVPAPLRVSRLCFDSETPGPYRVVVRDDLLGNIIIQDVTDVTHYDFDWSRYPVDHAYRWKAQGRMEGKWHDLNDYKRIKPKIINTFKKLSFEYNLSDILEEPGFVGFQKALDLKNRRSCERLNLFASVDPGGNEREALAFLSMRLLLGDELVYECPLSEINKPSYVSKPLKCNQKMHPLTLSLYVGSNASPQKEKKTLKDPNIDIKIEYLDITSFFGKFQEKMEYDPKE